ncbi:MAG: SsrA-binding protein SmpB [Pseudohongiellaceae bacterium]|jgi:SsrA-binding protein
MPKTKRNDDTTIVVNKKASHDYFIEDKYEAGLVLQGWEVKSLRNNKIQLVDSHVIIMHGEAWLLGAQIVPMASASTHHIADPTRTRKLLLNQKELARIFSGIQQKGYTCVCTRMYWKEHIVKCQIALAKGKHTYDKRTVEKDREWNITRQRTMQKVSKL